METQEKWLIHEHINAGNNIDYYHLFDSYDSANEFLKNYVQEMKAYICMDYLSECYDEEIGDSDDDENNEEQVSFDDYVKEYIKNPLGAQFVGSETGSTVFFKDNDYLVMAKIDDNYARRP